MLAHFLPVEILGQTERLLDRTRRASMTVEGLWPGPRSKSQDCTKNSFGNLGFKPPSENLKVVL